MNEQRLARLRRQMEQSRTDLVVLGPSSHLVWLAGLSPHGDELPVMLMVSKTGAAMLMPALNADSQRPLTNRFRTWKEVPRGFQDFAERNGMVEQFPDVLALIAEQTKYREETRAMALREAPGEPHGSRAHLGEQRVDQLQRDVAEAVAGSESGVCGGQHRRPIGGVEVERAPD